ncbi:MAG TPA: hypothetical protein VFQ65_27545 [Kofleriaceae bacterium]|nr:hypothetical protein [Kofleriaceae bacterium]
MVLLWSGVAFAGGKKIVVLDFKGPDAEKFHDDVVKLVEKDNKIVNTEKWNGAAEEADAKKFNTKSVQKVAKKVHADGVVWGKVEKDGDSYTLKLKLRAGKSGEMVGDEIEVTSDAAELKGKARKKVKEALLPGIDGLEEVGKDKDKDKDEPETKTPPPEEPKKPPEEVATAKHPKDKDKDKTETPAEPPPDEGEKHGKRHKHTAKVEPDETSTEEHASAEPVVISPDEALLPANRAVDFTIGMSFVARRLSFTFDSDLADQPSGYKQTLPVAGGVMDVTVYPLAFSHKNTGVVTWLGLEVMYDKVIFINSQKKYVDDMMNSATAKLSTVEDRFSIGAVVRYPISPALLVGGKILYSSQQFNIQQTFAGTMATDVPNVHYQMAEPKLWVKYSLGGPIMINGEAGFLLVTNTGGIQASNNSGYGAATVSGFELSAGLDYTLTKNLFIRALAKFESISLAFKGDPASLANTRDSDPMQDVQGAKDTYFGGMATIGYAF